MKLTLLLTLSLIVGSVPHGAAQSVGSCGTCKIGQTVPLIGSWTWAPNSLVEVYVRSQDFAADEVPEMLRAVQTWDASASENGSGVHFEYKGTVAKGETCMNCLTIIRDKVADRRHGAELQAFSRRNDQIIDYAWIVIDPSYRTSKILTSIIAHELGHSLGLLDCYGCKRGSSAMNRFDTTLSLFQIKVADWSNGIKGPTSYDVAQVKEAYKELRNGVRPAPIITSLRTADEGEEPEEDDTPIVLP